MCCLAPFGFDVTTLYFESFTEDDLRSFGFSKDCKFKETQVVLALITTTDGLPITYEVFPGNTHEIKTLLPVIKELKKEFDILDRLDKITDSKGEVAAKALVRNRGTKKYLRFDKEKKMATVDINKVSFAAAWDGISGYITNSEAPVADVIANYRRLWEIEESFRDNQA